MKVKLDYGDGGLEVDCPDDAMVIRPQNRAAVPDPREAVLLRLREPTSGPPLRDLVSKGNSVAISVCDGTRPQPRQPMVGAILRELREIGAAGRVTVLVATGTHAGNTPEELGRMLGDEILETCRVVNHDCRDDSMLVDLGTVDGDVNVALNRMWVESDVRITTGFVEPHFFAGFSGGPKMVAPGLAALDTVKALHNARRIGDERATWGIVEGNPVHDAIRAAAARCEPDFSVDVLLNMDKKVTEVFSGGLWPMHQSARSRTKEVAMSRVPHTFPLVVTSNSGFPLDQNLYQAVKGMSAAAEIVSEGGTIVCVAECRLGLPDGGAYARLLKSGDTIEEIGCRILESAEVVADQWQVQVQARVQQRAQVLVKASGLTAAQLESAHVTPVEDVTALIRDALRQDPDLPIAVLPEGPQTIAYVE